MGFEKDFSAEQQNKIETIFNDENKKDYEQLSSFLDSQDQNSEAVKNAKEKLQNLKNVTNEKLKEVFSKENKDVKEKWEALLNNPEFIKRLNSVAKNIWANPNDLIVVMRAESWLNPKAVNKTTLATWLIQFMPETAIWLWTSIFEIWKMTAVEQLNLVEKYYKQNSRWENLSSVTKLYQVVFYPLSLTKWKDFVFWTEKSPKYAKKVADQNQSIAKFSSREDWLIDWFAFEKYVLSKSDWKVSQDIIDWWKSLGSILPKKELDWFMEKAEKLLWQKENWLKETDVWWIWQLSIVDVLWMAYWALNIFWWVMDWFSWNWWDAIQKFTIAYVWIKNFSKEIAWNNADFEWEKNRIIESVFWEKLDKVDYSDKEHYHEFLDNAKNWRENYFKYLVESEQTTEWKMKPRVIEFINTNINFDKFNNNKNFTEESVSEIFNEKWEEGFNNLDENVKMNILNTLNEIKWDWVKSKIEFQSLVNYIYWNYNPNRFDKIRKNF